MEPRARRLVFNALTRGLNTVSIVPSNRVVNEFRVETTPYAAARIRPSWIGVLVGTVSRWKQFGTSESIWCDSSILSILIKTLRDRGFVVNTPHSRQCVTDKVVLRMDTVFVEPCMNTVFVS